MKQTVIIAVAGLLVAGCSGQPQVAPAPQAQKVAAAEQGTPENVESSQDADDRVICRTITPTGSHRKKKICRTVADIKKDRQSAQDALRRSSAGTAQAPGDL